MALPNSRVQDLTPVCFKRNFNRKTMMMDKSIYDKMGKMCHLNFQRMFQGIDRSGDNKVTKDEFMTEMCERDERE